MEKAISMEHWRDIQHRWARGESAYAISKSLGGKPSKQGISQKAKRHKWAELRVAGVLSSKHEEKPLVALGQDTPKARQAFLDSLSKGVYQSIAAPACFGVTYATVKNWRDSDPTFEMQVKSARARFAAKHIENIDAWAEKDWKAGKYLLETAPETRAEFTASNKSEKIEVIINIDRSGGRKTIDQDRERDHIEGSVIDVTPKKVNGDLS